MGAAKVAVYCRRLVGQVGQVGQVGVLIGHSTGGKAPKPSQTFPKHLKFFQLSFVRQSVYAVSVLNIIKFTVYLILLLIWYLSGV